MLEMAKTLFVAMDTVAFLVLGSLAIMSIWSITVIVMKAMRGRESERQNEAFLNRFAHISQFVEVKAICRNGEDGPLKRLSEEVLAEAQMFSAYVSYDSMEHRASLLEDTIQRAIESIRMDEDRKLGVLATFANLAPFMGLFGTVWGIMAAFYEIGKQGSADLSVVAPGISVALVTTIGGLLVAIPASAAFNYFTVRNSRNEIKYYNFGSRLLSLFKRGDLMALEDTARKE